MDITIIIGPNGTGKTAYLKQIDAQNATTFLTAARFKQFYPIVYQPCKQLYQTAASADKMFPARFQKAASAFLPQIGTDFLSLDFASLSTGTAWALSLAVILTAPEDADGDVLLLDCPECWLHPAWQSLVARMIKTATYKECYIVTHSSDFLDAFTEDFLRGEVKILVFGERGERRELGGEHLKADLEKGWMLGDLYRVGDPLIGGWP